MNKQKEMAIQDTIKRQFLIIEFLRKYPATFQEIDDYLQQKELEIGYKLSISQRTFQRDCIEILSLWDIEIGFNKRENKYEIKEDETTPYFNRVMEAFDIVRVLQQSKKVGQYLYLEKRKSKGTELFSEIFYAIENNLSVKFQHKNYWFGTRTDRYVVPLAIKESQNRYYLIAWDLNKKDFRSFGVDRINDLVITDQKNSAPKIDIEEYYQYSFGIERYKEPVKIVLEFDIAQKEYVNSLPLHSSQRITRENGSTFILELLIHPTNDFIMEILRYGSICEVLEPQELREEVKERIKQVYAKYC